MEIKASTFFSKEQQEQILSAIKQAEKATSGEIRVHIETFLAGDVLDRAAWIFKKIKMHETRARNGVLFYMALRNRQFAIIGDNGINEKVPEGFWDNVKELLEIKFGENRFTEGLVEAIILSGEQLRDHFPFEEDDVNELPDGVSFDDPDLINT